MSEPLDDYAPAEEILTFALERVRRERGLQAAYRLELLESLRTCELMIQEATNAENALESLLAGDLYKGNDEINARWDAAEQGPSPEDAGAEPIAEVVSEPQAESTPEAPQSTLPPAEPPSEPEVASAPEPPLSISSPASEAAKIDTPRKGRRPHAEHEDERALAALRLLAGDGPEVQVSLKVLSEASSVAQGSMLFVVRRLAEAGRIEVVPAPHEGGVKKPNIYRLLDRAAPETNCKYAPKYSDPIPGPAGAAPEPAEPLVEPQPLPKPALTFVPPAEAPEADPVSEDDFPLPVCDAGPKTLMNLRVNECHWPLGDPDPIQRYCGGACDRGAQYCADHAGAMYGRRARP